MLTAVFLYNQCSCCLENMDTVWEACLVYLWSNNLEPDSSPHQEQ